MGNESRNRVDIRLARRLKTFYRGKKCVFSIEPRRDPEEESSDTDWAHLDENHSNTSFQNIIPLNSSYNQAMERRKHPQLFLPADLLPAAIQDRASRQAKAHRTCAYGIYRLGAFLSAVSDPSQALEFAASALNCLLPYKDLSLAVDTIERNALPILSRGERIRPNAKFMICREILNHFEAAGDLLGAMKWLQTLQHLVQSHGLRGDELIKIRLLTHQAELHIATNNDAASIVLEELREMVGDTENPWGRTPIALAHAGYHATRGELDAAEEIIRHVLKNVGMMSNTIKHLVLQDNARLRAYARLHLADLLMKRRSARSSLEAMELVRESYEDLRVFGEALAWTIGPHAAANEFEARYLNNKPWQPIQRKEMSDLVEFSRATDRVAALIFE